MFEPAPDKRKVILATNIAEASLTIRNVKYVVDFGVAKVRGWGGVGSCHCHGIVSYRSDSLPNKP